MAISAIRVTLRKPKACFGLVVSDLEPNGIVINAAPIARYTMGWPAPKAIRYFLQRGATVEIPSDLMFNRKEE